jgi:hypothetical protein
MEGNDLRDPSQVHDAFWIFAFRRKDSRYPSPTVQSGKWLLFIPKSDIDGVWSLIREATTSGLLGDESKVSTARPSPLCHNQNESVICVYTYDSEDTEDVRRVRQELRNLGFNNKIPYKEDAQTKAGNYAGGGRIVSRYYE